MDFECGFCVLYNIYITLLVPFPRPRHHNIKELQIYPVVFFFIIRCGRVRLSLWTPAILLANSVPVQLAPRLIYCRAVNILFRKGVGGRD